jgi:hypothetical protein
VSSSFPGYNYAALSNWLMRSNSGISVHKTENERVDEHKLIVVHNLGDHGPDRTCIFTEDDTATLPVSRPQQGKGQLLFVRGFISPSWLAELGSTYRIDPEFFCRHLDFFDSSVHRSCFNTPSLLNTTNNIIHIHVSTILTDVMAYSTGNLYDNSVRHRALVRDHMSRYKRSLQKAASCGDSIIREYSILSNRYSIIEQRISICITENGDGWIGKLLYAYRCHTY